MNFIFFPGKQFLVIHLKLRAVFWIRWISDFNTAVNILISESQLWIEWFFWSFNESVCSVCTGGFSDQTAWFHPALTGQTSSPGEEVAGEAEVTADTRERRCGAHTITSRRSYTFRRSWNEQLPSIFRQTLFIKSASEMRAGIVQDTEENISVC